MALCCSWFSCPTTKVHPPIDVDDGSVFQLKDGKRISWKPGDLVQPLGSMETLMAVGGLYRSLNTVQAIWLKSKRPILEENVKRALWIMSRQIPHLQFCLARRGYRLWFKRVKNFNLDFETRTEDVMEVYEELLASKYNVWNDPLWKVRMIVPNANNKCGENDFSAVLIFSVQHCITDGFTNMKICKEVVHILNAMELGKNVDYKLVPLSPTIDHSMDNLAPLSFLVKHFCKKFTATMLRNFYHKSSFNNKIPIPDPSKSVNRVLHTEISEEQTSALIKMCKQSNITVHSCIVTMTNFALLQLAQSKSAASLGPCVLRVTHCVNMRRYFNEENKETSGCHISLAEDKNKISLHEAYDFWNQAKKVHSSIKDSIENAKTQLKVVPLLQLASMIFPANVYLTKHGYKNKTDCHYVTTNMGNLKELLPGPVEGDIVEITNVLRSVSSNLAGNPFLLTFHTFRNKFMLSIDYCTCKMMDEIAEEFFAILRMFLNNVVTYGTLYEPNKI